MSFNLHKLRFIPAQTYDKKVLWYPFCRQFTGAYIRIALRPIQNHFKTIAVKNETHHALYNDVRFWLALLSLLCLIGLSMGSSQG